MLPGGGGRAKQQKSNKNSTTSCPRARVREAGGRWGRGAKNMINVQKNVSCKTVKQKFVNSFWIKVTSHSIFVYTPHMLCTCKGILSHMLNDIILHVCMCVHVVIFLRNHLTCEGIPTIHRPWCSEYHWVSPLPQ